MRTEIKQEYTGVIILNYNNYEDTINCIESVDTYNSSKIKFVIVDNGSTRKDAVSSLDSFLSEVYRDDYMLCKQEVDAPVDLPRCTLFVNENNLGYAAGNNIGLRLASFDESITHVMILNNDVLFVEDIIPSLLAELERMDDCAIISPALFKKGLVEYDDTCARMAPTARDLIFECLMLGVGFNGFRNRIRNKYWLFVKNPSLKSVSRLQIQMPSGSCMLIRKELFQNIGFFDANTFLYFEENILFAKINKLGLNNYLLPQLRCIHLGASSTKKSPSAFIQMCGLKSRVYYLTTYCDLTVFDRVLLYFAKHLMGVKIKIKQLIQK